MEKQLTIFDFLLIKGALPQIGDYVDQCGKPLLWEDLHPRKNLIYDCSTQSRRWLRFVQIKDLIVTPDGMRVVLCCGRGDTHRLLINRKYIDSGEARLYSLPK